MVVCRTEWGGYKAGKMVWQVCRKNRKVGVPKWWGTGEWWYR